MSSKFARLPRVRRNAQSCCGVAVIFDDQNDAYTACEPTNQIDGKNSSLPRAPSRCRRGNFWRRPGSRPNFPQLCDQLAATQSVTLLSSLIGNSGAQDATKFPRSPRKSGVSKVESLLLLRSMP